MLAAPNQSMPSAALASVTFANTPRSRRTSRETAFTRSAFAVFVFSTLSAIGLFSPAMREQSM